MEVGEVISSTGNRDISIHNVFLTVQSSDWLSITPALTDGFVFAILYEMFHHKVPNEPVNRRFCDSLNDVLRVMFPWSSQVPRQYIYIILLIRDKKIYTYIEVTLSF